MLRTSTLLSLISGREKCSARTAIAMIPTIRKTNKIPPTINRTFEVFDIAILLKSYIKSFEFSSIQLHLHHCKYVKTRKRFGVSEKGRLRLDHRRVRNGQPETPLYLIGGGWGEAFEVVI